MAETTPAKEEVEELIFWLYSSKSCTCGDFRGEDPNCKWCRTAEILDVQKDAIDELAKVSERVNDIRPIGYFRRLRTTSTPHDPGEYYDEFSGGDDRPEGESWEPLYSAPQLAVERERREKAEALLHGEPGWPRDCRKGIDALSRAALQPKEASS
jgi:hypothetical protein